MIILLAFFILLSSIAVIDERRQIEAMGSVLGAFGLLPGGLSPTEGVMKYISPPTSPLNAIENDVALLREILQNQIIEKKVHFLRGRSQRIISLESALLFPPDEVELLPTMKPLLAEVAGIVKGSDYPIIIEGHTDDQPPKTEAYRDNWVISALRATAVVRFLIEEGQIDPARLSAYGYAGNKPVVPNYSPKDRARNNRIDLIIDSSSRRQADEYSDRHRRLKFFDFKGFNFRLFGDED
jgi:chemotaxis protein MotB